LPFIFSSYYDDLITLYPSLNIAGHERKESKRAQIHTREWGTESVWFLSEWLVAPLWSLWFHRPLNQPLLPQGKNERKCTITLPNNLSLSLSLCLSVCWALNQRFFFLLLFFWNGEDPNPNPFPFLLSLSLSLSLSLWRLWWCLWSFW
jgi:hypothetical protein